MIYLLYATLAVCVCIMLVEYRHKYIKRQKKIYTNRLKFFRASVTINRHLNTPDSVLELIDWMNDTIDSPKDVWKILRRIFSSKWQQMLKRPSCKIRVLRKDRAALPKSLSEALNEAVKAYLLSKCYMRPVIGLLLRRICLLLDNAVIIDILADVGIQGSKPRRIPSGGTTLSAAA
jgi:hypothetical protein